MRESGVKGEIMRQHNGKERKMLTLLKEDHLKDDYFEQLFKLNLIIMIN